MERDGDSPSFWFQPPITLTRSYRRPSSPIINPVILIILLPILALLLLFFLLPPVLSHASFIFRPNSVKKSWDSVNVFLVLFAVLCGVLARRNHDTSSTDVNDAVNAVSFDDKLNSSVPDIWFEDSDTKFYTSKVGVPENGVRRLRRNSSYPDLKQESPWETGDNRYRFYDDFAVNLNLNRSPGSEYVHHRVRRSEVSEVDTDESDVKEIPVDTFVNRSSPSLPRKSPSPPPAPPMKNLSRRTYRSVPKQDEVENRSENNETEFLQIPTPPPTPPPPPPAAEKPRLQQKREKRDRKINSATKDIATTITSLYNQSKRKRKHKTRNIYDNSTQSPPSAHSVETVESELPPAPAPPPPPPPLPSVFHNMFRKGTKSKRIHSLSATVPPAPPPPPPGSIFNNMFKNSSKSKRFSATTTNSISSAPPPPPPPPSSILNTLFKTGSQSKRFQSTSISPPSSPPAPPASLISNQKSKRMSHIHIQPPPPPPPPQQPEYSRRRTASSWKPPLPTRANSYYEREEYLNSGAQSPLIPVPPPPPPFKMAETKFMFSCEISSNQSSRSTSPERENVGSSSMNRSPSPSYGGASTGSGFCPSPDVNVKAASFIARLRDEWRLEKMNSVKERQKMGPTAGP